ncbi:membrane-targeted effector domain-containing toxin [Pseudomonas fontis]|uniref:Membrane-targeted effector domain-containing toxin n=1 Tax=Pseudomonas fontis TaxID=2942633 RepID=A0ABT5NX03_9PSED|nr:membrane-targeted effector domain-containing toxin [Pseudomonas fontis]MDD0975066.1 membrane-targeted effector domain-containing toxin [Pseudomonas fontis]MDD0992713.1 membrane-targeted effector domain-containing toxin [Pseudomonas fontis]
MSADTAPTELHATLDSLARTVIGRIPDLQRMANQVARHLLEPLGIHDDPDTFYWHRFSNADSSSRSYNGFEHAGPPTESMTFTELLMHRFSAHDQDNADLLNLWGGFYRDGPDAAKYDERNEIRLLPQRVLPALWRVDFSAAYHQALSHFWQVDADNMRTLVRITALSSAIATNQAGRLTREQVQIACDGLGVDQPMALTLAELAGERTARAGTTVSSLHLAGHGLVSTLCIAAPSGARMLYLAGATPAFMAFDDERSLQQWLQQQLRSDQERERLLSHCAIVEPAVAQAREKTLLGLANLQLKAFARKLELKPLSADACAWLRDGVHQQMLTQADLLLRSNADLRKQLWIGYLSVGLRLVGPMAALAWPVALVVVVAGTANLGLNIEQAFRAHSTAERKAALIGAIMGGVELLLNLTLLIPAAWPSAQALEPLQVSLPAELPVPPVVDAQGVFVLESGQYIHLDGMVYRVRFDASLQSWLVVDPERPFSFNGNYPVRLNSQLEWEQVEGANLRGGGANQSTAQVAPVEIPMEYAFSTPLANYEVPLAARDSTRQLLSNEFRRMLSGDYYFPESPLNEVKDNLERLRAELLADATRFIDRLPTTLPRTGLYYPDLELPATVAFRRLFDEAEGVVVGEAHSSIASKRFLMENMQAMARNGVETLYLEHLMSDLHQLDLDLFARTGNMTHALEDYLRDLDVGHHTDPTGEYTYMQLVKTAQKRAIRVRALDCAASYRLDGLDMTSGTLRQKIFSYYASRVIRPRQAAPGRGKWVALVGNTHVCRYKGVPGLAQLKNVTGLRIVDAGVGQATNMTPDPGEYFASSMGNPDGVVRADWRLAIQTRTLPYRYLDPSLAPPGVLQP